MAKTGRGPAAFSLVPSEAAVAGPAQLGLAVAAQGLAVVVARGLASRQMELAAIASSALSVAPALMPPDAAAAARGLASVGWAAGGRLSAVQQLLLLVAAGDLGS